MLKKNMEQAELALLQEKDNVHQSFNKIESGLSKRDSIIAKKDKQVKQLQDEIDRRKYLEAKVQSYVKGLIG